MYSCGRLGRAATDQSSRRHGQRHRASEPLAPCFVRCNEDRVRFAKPPRRVPHRFCLVGFRSRTPGPSPFSSMNTTPAPSRARRTARSLAAVMEVSPSANSARRIVATLNELSRARSSALHRISERAARICALVNGCRLPIPVRIRSRGPLISHTPLFT